MPSGDHRLTAFILWPFSPSKKSPLDPPSPWSWLGAYGRLKQIRRDFFVSNEKRRRREPGLFSAEIQRNRRQVISV